MNATASNSNNKIHLGFQGASYSYLHEFGQPIHLNGNVNTEELVLMEITISDNSLKGVYDVKIGDSKDSVLSKIDTKPKKIEPHSTDKTKTNIFYEFDKYKLQVHLDSNDKVNFIRAKQYSKSELLNQLVKRSIQEQKVNILPMNSTKLEELKNFEFLKQWTNISDEHIGELSKVLRAYLENLKEHTLSKSSSKIYSQTSKLVKQINKLNNSLNIIHTSEREELVEFIEKSVRATGFVIPDNLDITEEHRLW